MLMHLCRAGMLSIRDCDYRSAVVVTHCVHTNLFPLLSKVQQRLDAGWDRCEQASMSSHTLKISPVRYMWVPIQSRPSVRNQARSCIGPCA